MCRIIVLGLYSIVLCKGIKFQSQGFTLGDLNLYGFYEQTILSFFPK